MKRKLTLIALALALLPGLAIAQNITRSLQGNVNDPRGPVGWDTSNAMYFPNHINSFGPAPVPSLTVCGSGSVMQSGSTDNAGHWLQNAGTSCIVVFTTPFNAPPNCVVSTTGAVSIPFVTATATTSFLVSNIQAATSVYYVCLGNQ